MYLIAALLAGGAGTAGYQMIYPPRPNPFTSVDADQMEERLISRIARLEGKVEGHLDFSSERVRDYEHRLTKLEERCNLAFKER